MTIRAKLWTLLLPAVATLSWMSGAAAAPVTDPAGDFLPTYIGPPNGDLDLLSASVEFDGTAFTLHVTTAGMIGTTPGALYALWVNRGAGVPRFGPGAPGLLFDAVGVFRPAGPDVAVDLAGVPPGAPTITLLPADAFAFAGSSFVGVLPLSLFPSTGFPPGDYMFALGSRIGDTAFDQIADFAPDEGMFATIPEPAPVALLLGGVVLLGWARRWSAWQSTERVPDQG